MIRILTLTAFLLCLGGFFPATAGAQSAAPLAAVPQAPAAAQKPPPAADPAQVKDLIQTLNDPAQRDKLVGQLNLLLKQQAAQKPTAEDPVGSRILKFLSGQVHEVTDEFDDLGHAFRGLPVAGRWFENQMTNPVTRAHWIDLGTSLAMVLAAGAVALAIVYFLVRAPRHAIERQHRSSIFGRVAFGLIRLAVWLIPVGAFGIAGYALLSVIDPPPTVSLATLAIINATLIVLGVIALSQFVLAPRFANLRLIKIGDKPATFLHRWICWIAAILSYGGFGITAARLLGLPGGAAHAAFKVVGLVVLIILVSLILGKRKPVARWIRGDQKRKKAASSLPSAALWSTRRRLADIWHFLAIAYLVILFGVWIFAVEGGFEFVLRATVISLAAIAAARLAILAIEHGVERGVMLTRDQKGRHPRIQARADRYLPIIHVTASIVVWLIALIGVVDVWGGDTFAWFDTANGQAATGKTVSILFVVISAVIAWEFVSAIIENYLVGAVRDGTPVERSQRVRTLLPLLHNAFLIFLFVVVLLIVLSEIGLNIAPLLAGAGVVGLAIGFGAQTLVKDVITGVFILFENTIAVGDVVDLGGGHSGLVEHFSIRTIKLRDSAGGVHTVPFSAVTSVNNMTKDFAYYVFNIKVDYAQDTDKVVDVVKALGQELQNDMNFCDLILAPIEIIGVDSFGSDAVVLQARFKTKPIKQWSVGREFNRRMKKRFDELKIPLTFPQSMVVLPAGAGPQAAASQAPQPEPGTDGGPQ
jgi:small conductance mechanosensitive channel